jgi:DNA-binding NarL/FixJ family response regulator
MRCLIVDDSSGFLAAARRLLERQGVTVAGVASNGAEAERRFDELRPDVVLVDLGLGSESGLDVAERLAGMAGGESTAIILISTRSGEEYHELVEAGPAVGFIPKDRLSAGAIEELVRASG